MGKARGPKRKEAPARKRLQAGNSGLLHKQSHRNPNGGAHRAAGLDGEAKRVGRVGVPGVRDRASEGLPSGNIPGYFVLGSSLLVDVALHGMYNILIHWFIGTRPQARAGRCQPSPLFPLVFLRVHRCLFDLRLPTGVRLRICSSPRPRHVRRGAHGKVSRRAVVPCLPATSISIGFCLNY